MIMILSLSGGVGLAILGILRRSRPDVSLINLPDFLSLVRSIYAKILLIETYTISNKLTASRLVYK